MSAKIAAFFWVVVAASACSGESSTRRRAGGEAGADAGEGAAPGTGGSENMGGFSGVGGSAGTATSGAGGLMCNFEADPWITLDASDCAERPEGDCTGMACNYSSGLDRTPALADCDQYVSFDGCGALVFEIDANGCATGIGPPPQGWDRDEHLGALRECMTAALARARFTCLASRTLSFLESCFID